MTEHPIEHPLERTGDSLCSLVDLWEIVSDALGITIKQAADFVEKEVEGLGLVLWIDDEYTGLWKPIDHADPDSAHTARDYLLEAWNSGESNHWTGAYIQQWRFLRLTPKAFRAIEDAALEIKNGAIVSDASRPVASRVNLTEEVDPSDLPNELDSANQAFRAVTKGSGDQSATFRNRLVEYLEKTFPSLSPEAVRRIATVANPDKSTGRKRRGKE